MFLKLLDAYFGIVGIFGFISVLIIIIITTYKLITKKNFIGLILLIIILSLFFIYITNKILIYASIVFLVLNALYYFNFIIRYLFLKKDNANMKNNDYPFISIVIPINNESKVIKDSLDSISKLDYPISKYDIIVIDDFSTDNSYEIILSLKKQIKNLKIIKNNISLGKSISLNNIINNIESEYILILDADHLIDKYFLKKALLHFQNQKVACVQGKNIVRNGNASLLSRLIEIEYHHRYEVLYTGRSLPLFVGSGGIFKTDVLKKLFGFNKDILTEDLEISYRIYESGYKIIFDNSIATYELATIDIKNFLKQRNRWFRGIWQLILIHLPKITYHNILPFFSKINLYHIIIENLALSSYLFTIILTSFDFFGLFKFDFKYIVYLKTLLLIIISCIALIKVKKPMLMLFFPFVTLYYQLYSFPNLLAMIDNWILKTEFKWIKTDRSNIKDVINVKYILNEIEEKE